LNIFARFQPFFARFYLAYFTQTLQADLSTLIFTPKINIPEYKNYP